MLKSAQVFVTDSHLQFREEEIQRNEHERRTQVLYSWNEAPGYNFPPVGKFSSHNIQDFGTLSPIRIFFHLTKGYSRYQGRITVVPCIGSQTHFCLSRVLWGCAVGCTRRMGMNTRSKNLRNCWWTYMCLSGTKTLYEEGGKHRF